MNTNHYVDDDDGDAENEDAEGGIMLMMILIMMLPGLVLCGTLQICEVAFA